MRQMTVGMVLGVLLVVGVANAQDVGWPPAPVEKTGQTAMVDTGDDGDLQTGIALPSPRFVHNEDQNWDGDCDDAGETCDGTVTDLLTGLVWLRYANCSPLFEGDDEGSNWRAWSDAVEAARLLESGYCQLTDGSSPGDWRLPNVRELHSLIHYGYREPALSNAMGTGHHSDGGPFLDLQWDPHWSSTTEGDPPDSRRIGDPREGTRAWRVIMRDGTVETELKTERGFVIPVREGPIFADGFGPGGAQQWSGEAP